MPQFPSENALQGGSSIALVYDKSKQRFLIYKIINKFMTFFIPKQAKSYRSIFNLPAFYYFGQEKDDKKLKVKSFLDTVCFHYYRYLLHTKQFDDLK